MEQIGNIPALKYQGYAIVCQEVPDEISLAFNISGCPYHCEGCHSQFLWNYEGDYLHKDFNRILSENHKLITCVCFMGGDQNMEELKILCGGTKYIYGLKTCIYTGSEDYDKFLPLIEMQLIDYLKLGRYDKSCGGLDKETTNQRMYKFENRLFKKDITNKFYAKKE